MESERRIWFSFTVSSTPYSEYLVLKQLDSAAETGEHLITNQWEAVAESIFHAVYESHTGLETSHCVVSNKLVSGCWLGVTVHKDSATSKISLRLICCSHL